MLHWIARARAALVPPAARSGAVLVDFGCGAGLLAPHVLPLGYRVVGLDLVAASLAQAADHGVAPICADVHAVPLRDGCADVVSAGEILEHVADPSTVIAEACRVLRPGGLLVLDTINATALGRFVTVTVGERIPGGAPKGIHDPRLFVPPDVLRHGVRPVGRRPADPGYPPGGRPTAALAVPAARARWPSCRPGRRPCSTRVGGSSRHERLIRRRWWRGYGRGSPRGPPSSTGPGTSRSRTSPISGRPDCSACSRPIAWVGWS